MTMTKAFGQTFFALCATSRMIGRFVATRSSRDWPGLRGMPAVMMRTSAPSRSAQLPVPRMLRVVAEDGAVLLEVERLALGEVLLRRDVEEQDVAELLVRAEPRELSADVACADETDLLAGGHGRPFSAIYAPHSTCAR